jgi:hypothetical protein
VESAYFYCIVFGEHSKGGEIMNLQNMLSTKFTLLEWALIKLSVMSFALFLVSVWEGFANWVINTHWAWFQDKITPTLFV